MWKKLFYNASKNFANDVSRSYGNKMKEKMVKDRIKQSETDYRNSIVAEYQDDIEKQHEVELIDEVLEVLLSTHRLCLYAFQFVDSPFGCDQDLIFDRIHEQHAQLIIKSNNLLKIIDDELDDRQQIIIKATSIYPEIIGLIFGEEEEQSSGIIGVIAEVMDYIDDDSVHALWHATQDRTLDLLNDTIDQLKEMFLEYKKYQIVSYAFYDVTGEVDFGAYTFKDFVDNQQIIQYG
ncbi:hypothetical protein [Halobacillus sp. H74]|uniref:hypothetical protein n=1 Tax=Halobacillus sp. H74 TaxID=3457436 RepID=UPI003FCEB72D